MTDQDLARTRATVIGSVGATLYVGDCIRFLAQSILALKAPTPPAEVSRSLDTRHDSDGNEVA